MAGVLKGGGGRSARLFGSRVPVGTLVAFGVDAAASLGFCCQQATQAGASGARFVEDDPAAFRPKVPEHCGNGVAIVYTQGAVAIQAFPHARLPRPRLRSEERRGG